MDLIQLIYVSAATTPFTPPQLRALLEMSRTRNASIGVSGLLLYHQGSFFQILEGDEQVVMKLYWKISKDPRHASIILLSKTTAEKRAFGEWTMGFVDIAGLSAGAPGFLHLLNATSSFLDLQRDNKLIGKLVDGFQDGRWRQHIS